MARTWSDQDEADAVFYKTWISDFTPDTDQRETQNEPTGSAMVEPLIWHFLAKKTRNTKPSKYGVNDDKLVP